MLRFLAIVLLAGNLLFFGFTRGWFDGMFGMHALGDREPERLAAQVRPGSIVLTPMPASGVAGRSVDAVTCLEAGPVSAADAPVAEAALRGVLAPSAWVDNRVEAPNGFTTVVTHTYRVPSADATTASRLAALRLDPSGHAFSACAASAPAR